MRPQAKLYVLKPKPAFVLRPKVYKEKIRSVDVVYVGIYNIFFSLIGLLLTSFCTKFKLSEIREVFCWWWWVCNFILTSSRHVCVATFFVTLIIIIIFFFCKILILHVNAIYSKWESCFGTNDRSDTNNPQIPKP